MKVFLIIVAVIVILIALLMSLSATITIIFDNGWHTTIQVLFIKKDIVLSQILSFIMFPEKKGEQARENRDNQKKNNEKSNIDLKSEIDDKTEKLDKSKDNKESTEPKKEAKPNAIKKIWDEEGIVGIMSFITNLIDTGSAAITTFFKGFHIYSLYVKMIIGGSDAADIAQDYGTVCAFYYPLKGIILNGMKVDEYDDYVQPDFIAPRSEYELQFIGSLSVGLIVRMLLRAGIVFLKNYIKSK